MTTRTLLEVVGAIFFSGGYFVWTKMAIAQLRRDVKFTGETAYADKRKLEADLRKDINGIGAKLGKLQEREDRRKVNADLAILLNAKPDKTTETAALLKE